MVIIKRKTIQAALSGIIVICICAVWSLSFAKREVLPTSAELSTSFERQVLVIDAGHGGADGGCVSVDGIPEKGINLNILLTLKDIAAIMGYDTVCTRETDISIHDDGITGLSNQKKSDMNNRLALFNKYDNAIAVSIHQNQFTDSQYSGAQMFYSNENPYSESFAECLRSRFVSVLQPYNERETKPVGNELFLLHNAACPAVMIECGFLSNPDEAAKLQNEDYQKQVAFTIFMGINDFAGVKAASKG